MREIKFRGKRVDNGEWVYGAFVPDATERTHGDMVTWGFIRRHNIESGRMKSIEVDRKSVGQYTGLKDKNGVEIYEGDIAKVPHYLDGRKKILGVVKFVGVSYVIDVEDMEYASLFVFDECEIVGNIHENPDLLEASHD